MLKFAFWKETSPELNGLVTKVGVSGMLDGKDY